MDLFSKWQAFTTTPFHCCVPVESVCFTSWLSACCLWVEKSLLTAKDLAALYISSFAGMLGCISQQNKPNLMLWTVHWLGICCIRPFCFHIKCVLRLRCCAYEKQWCEWKHTTQEFLFFFMIAEFKLVFPVLCRAYTRLNIYCYIITLIKLLFCFLQCSFDQNSQISFHTQNK